MYVYIWYIYAKYSSKEGGTQSKWAAFWKPKDMREYLKEMQRCDNILMQVITVLSLYINALIIGHASEPEGCYVNIISCEGVSIILILAHRLNLQLRSFSFQIARNRRWHTSKRRGHKPVLSIIIIFNGVINA